MATIKLRTVVCAMIVALGLPAAASASTLPRPSLPNGYSGIQQYTESIPTAGGQRATGTIQPSSGSTSTSGSASSGSQGAIPGSTQTQLLHAGSAGQQAASLAAATAPAIAVRRTGQERRTSHRSRRGHRSSHSRSSVVAPVTTPPGSSGGTGSSSGPAVADALTGGSGAHGFILPVLLVLIAVGAVAVRLRRQTPID